MPGPEHVRMRHPDHGEWECPPRAVEHFEGQGWEIVPIDDEPATEPRPRRRAASTRTHATKPATSTTSEE
jgi:hypothetical protein